MCEINCEEEAKRGRATFISRPPLTGINVVSAKLVGPLCSSSHSRPVCSNLSPPQKARLGPSNLNPPLLTYLLSLFSITNLFSKELNDRFLQASPRRSHTLPVESGALVWIVRVVHLFRYVVETICATYLARTPSSRLFRLPPTPTPHRSHSESGKLSIHRSDSEADTECYHHHLLRLAASQSRRQPIAPETRR
jgi:hypothetical protein